mmetsp:Transcript_39864/g.71652  ORF Transcript_39864/g.71652 Transcript_39864/m.71652 type:complete len:221 (-) Transcript_39864:15-677(-)
MAAASLHRRSKALPALVAIATVVALSGRAANFIGKEAITTRSAGAGVETALRAAAKAKKKKQRLSLSEALDRQEEEKKKAGMSKKEDAKITPELTFWEGPPSSTELFFPFLACFVVLGIVPLIAAAYRQFTVKYRLTDRRISIASGWGGKDVTEFSYEEIDEMSYGLRWTGYCADMRFNLRDGAKVEIFGLLNFEDNYEYMLSKCDKDTRKRSMRLPRKL